MIPLSTWFLVFQFFVPFPGPGPGNGTGGANILGSPNDLSAGAWNFVAGVSSRTATTFDCDTSGFNVLGQNPLTVANGSTYVVSANISSTFAGGFSYLYVKDSGTAVVLGSCSIVDSATPQVCRFSFTAVSTGIIFYYYGGDGTSKTVTMTGSTIHL